MQNERSALDDSKGFLVENRENNAGSQEST